MALAVLSITRHWSTSGASLLSSLVNAFFVHSITVQIILVSWQSLKHAVTTGVTYRIRLEKKKGSWNHWQVRGKIISRWKSSYVRREASQLFPISGLKFTLVPTPVVANIPHLWRRWWESCWMGPRTEQRFTPPHITPVCGRGSSRYLSWEIPLHRTGPFLFFVDSPFHLSYAEPLKHHVQRRNKRQSGKTCVLLSTVTCLFSVFFTHAWFRLRLSRATRIGWKLHPEGPIDRSDSGGPHTWKKANGRLWGDTAKMESRCATSTCQIGAMGINSHSWYASKSFGFFCYAHEQPDDWRIEED